MNQLQKYHLVLEKTAAIAACMLISLSKPPAKTPRQLLLSRIRRGVWTSCLYIMQAGPIRSDT